MGSLKPKRLLVANRGEVAARLVQGAADQGWETVAVHAADDDWGRYLRRADRAVALPGRGVAAYLDADAIIAAAIEHGCRAVHPGWGFLAERADFAAACAAARLVFVGPSPEQLRLFGDKLAARTLAERCDVPVLEASSALADAEALTRFAAGLESGARVVIKAAAGGGGRGMRVLDPGDDPGVALERCRAEALAAFGDGTVYAERYLEPARHVEVQIVGDAHGAATHLWDRDCSLQRRHQKLIEVAPAPGLPEALRGCLLAAALRMAREVGYRSLGTFEFLVDAARGTFFFIEANPRLQVEHTVTEMVLGLDLVALQLALAEGATLAELGLDGEPPRPRGSAVQLRVNAETVAPDGTALASAGTVTRLETPGGAGVRIDSADSSGDWLNPAFDSLLLKLVVNAPGNGPAGGLEAALARAGRAAG
jgi:acetyl/propionyl-CoA carboxylase alpha subunit